MTEGEGEGGGSMGGWGSVEERVMMLEQRTEQQERETSTLKVSCGALSQSHNTHYIHHAWVPITLPYISI